VQRQGELLGAQIQGELLGVQRQGELLGSTFVCSREFALLRSICMFNPVVEHRVFSRGPLDSHHHFESEAEVKL